MTDVVVIKEEDDGNVSREEAHEIAESHANDAEERSAERDVHLSQMIGDAVQPLHDRIAALEQPVIVEPEPEPVTEVVETVPETPAESDIDTAADETEAEEITADAEHETAPVVEDDKEEEKSDKPARTKRDRQPRQRRNVLTTLLGGSGGVRRGR